MGRGHDIFEDLLDVEVNTLVTDRIRVDKMPALPFALLDIIAIYSQALLEVGVDLDAYLRPTRAECWARILAHERARDARATDEAAPPWDKDYIEAARQTYRTVHDREAPSRAELLAGRFDEVLFNCLPDLWAAFPAVPRVARPDGGIPVHVMTGVTNGWDSFERLRIAAMTAAPSLAGERATLVVRIVGATNRLKFLVQKLEQRGDPPPAERRWFRRRRRPGPDVAAVAEMIPKTRDALLVGDLRHKRFPQLLHERESRVLRKIWELGDDHVLVQTSVQLDGDVVTRISRHLLAETEAPRELLDAHQRGVDVGIKNWRALVDAAIELVDRAFGKDRR